MAGAAQPAIRTGVRGIGDVVRKPSSPTESEWDRAVARVALDLKFHPPAEGVRVFMSRSRNYRYQVTAPITTYDPLTQQAIPKEPITAQFRDYQYRVSDATDDGKLIINKITGSKYFRVEIFDAEDVVRRHNVAVVDALIAQVQEAPEELRESVVERLLGGLGSTPGKKSLGLPKREGAKAEEAAAQ